MYDHGLINIITFPPLPPLEPYGAASVWCVGNQMDTGDAFVPREPYRATGSPDWPTIDAEFPLRFNLIVAAHLREHARMAHTGKPGEIRASLPSLGRFNRAPRFTIAYEPWSDEHVLTIDE